MNKHLKHWLQRLFLIAALLSGAGSALAADFCWASSYGRGVGTLPTACTGGRNVEVGMCYEPCRTGYQGAVTMCLRNCPSGYVNTGLTCHVDKPLLVGASVDACTFSTSCPSGYTNAGLLCGLNTPPVPAGYTAAVSGPAASGLDLSREIYDRGIGKAPTICEGGKDNSGGLCYPGCKPNFTGVGPVCWNQCPAGWKPCGMGCAKSGAACAAVVVGQVAGVGMAAAQTGALVASLGTSAGATTPVTASRFPELALKVEQLKKLYEANKAAITLATNVATVAAAQYKLQNAVTIEEVAAASAAMTGLLDPTGLMSAAAGFVHPTCDKVSQ